MSLRAKLILAVVLLTAGSLAGVGLFVGLHLRAWSHEVLDAKLTARAADLAVHLEDDDLDHETFEPHHGPPVRVEDERGGVLRETPFPWPALPPAAGEPITVETADGRALRVLSRRVPPYVLHVAADEEPYHELGARLFRGLIAALIGATALGAAGALVIARATLRPVVALARAVEAIEPSRLHVELPRGERDPELRRLVHAFDALLERLRQAFDRERAFTARASHALRTPLATLRTQLEVALRRERSAEEYAALLREARATTVEAAALSDGLLALARAEAREGPSPGVKAHVSELLPALSALIEPRARAEGRPTRWDAPEPLVVRADPSGLTELLSALLDNALRYGRGALGLTVRGDHGRVRFEVWDEGPGLTAEDHQGLFQRFFRGSAASATGAPGSGLGLATARAIAERFGGSLTLEPREGGGARAVLTLPRA